MADVPGRVYRLHCILRPSESMDDGIRFSGWHGVLCHAFAFDYQVQGCKYRPYRAELMVCDLDYPRLAKRTNTETAKRLNGGSI